MTRPLCIDLFCGLGGWTEGFLTEGWDVVGFDIERHVYDDQQYPAQLVLQDVRTIHGKQFKNAHMIVASSPCPEYSYMAMPWSRAKQIARALRGEGDFPEGYKGSRTIAELNELFEHPRRIQREACEAAGRFIPLIQENVKGAQPWVGPAQWHYGSFYLWGDIPALMPLTLRAQKFNPDGTAHPPGSWFGIADSKNRGAKSTKNDGGSWFNVGSPGQKVTNRNPVHEGQKAGDRNAHRASAGALKSARFTNPDELPTDGVKQHKSGRAWFADPDSISGSTWPKSLARKAASARIAKIPLALARHIAHVYQPREAAVA